MTPIINEIQLINPAVRIKVIPIARVVDFFFLFKNRIYLIFIDLFHLNQFFFFKG